MYFRKETLEHEMQHLCSEINCRENTNVDVHIIREYTNEKTGHNYLIELVEILIYLANIFF